MNGKEEYIKKTSISIILVYNFHYCYLTPPLELVFFLPKHRSRLEGMR